MEYRKIYLAALVGISTVLVGTAGTALANNNDDNEHAYGGSHGSSYERYQWSNDDYRNGNYTHSGGYWDSREGNDGDDGKDGTDESDGSYGRGSDRDDDDGYYHQRGSNDDDDEYSDDDDDSDVDTSDQHAAHLTGDEEVPRRDTDATGNFAGDIDDEEGDYDLDVFDGTDITMAHLHCAPKGENGPIVVTLFHNDAGVDVDGNLANGTFDDSDIEATAHDCDNPIYDLEDLVREINDGNIYVNVHSKQFPAGEIRGQLEQMNGSDDDDHGDDDDYDDHHGDYGNGSDDDENSDHSGDDWMNGIREKMHNRIDEMRSRMENRMSQYH